MFQNKKILIITPERLGDTLMCTPAIHYLKSNYPSIHIDVLASSELSAETLKNNPDINDIIILPKQPTLRYDMGINIHGDAHLRLPLEALKLKIYDMPPIDYSRHQAECELDFVKSLSPEHFEITDRHYKLFPNRADREHVQAVFKENQLNPEKDILVGCQIGCHSIAKKKWAVFKKLTHPKIWPIEYFLELAKRLYDYNPHIRLILTGSNSEKVLGKKLVKKVPSIINFIDRTNVLQLRALIDEMDLFLSPDTGVMHVACSANIPLIALFGPTNLTRTGPYPELNDLEIIRGKTMEDISVDIVFNAIIAKLKKLHRL